MKSLILQAVVKDFCSNFIPSSFKFLPRPVEPGAIKDKTKEGVLVYGTWDTIFVSRHFGPPPCAISCKKIALPAERE